MAVGHVPATAGVIFPVLALECFLGNKFGMSSICSMVVEVVLKMETQEISTLVGHLWQPLSHQPGEAMLIRDFPSKVS